MSKAGADLLFDESTARDFIADAYAHLKCIGYVPEAIPLMEKAGIPPTRDDGLIELSGKDRIPVFIQAASNLRLWEREPRVKCI